MNGFKTNVVQRYVSRAYDRQNKKGDGYDVAPVYLIGLMGTDIVHKELEKWLHHRIRMYGGVRGRKTKVGGKPTFVFLLLDLCP